jgi:hypothetical protein
VSAAQWWDRVRVDASILTSDELRLARTARAAVGRAIRDARHRRSHPEPAYIEPTGMVIPFPSDGRPLRRAMLGVALFAVIALVLVIFLLPNLRESPAPAAAAPEIPKPVATLSPAGGRGRTAASFQPVAVAPVAPVATPVPTETPPPATQAPVAAEAPAPVTLVAPAGTPTTGGQPGGVLGGVAGGTPGGVVGGTPGGTGTRPIAAPPATPPPSYIPAGTPPPQAQGSDRFYFKIIDSASRTPLQNVCVIYGLIECVYSNSLGLYWIDVDPNASRWGFSFSRDDYWPATIIETYQPGMGSVPTSVYLRHK